MQNPANIPNVILKRDYKPALALAHPWLFKSAIESIEGPFEPGCLVKVLDHKRCFLAWGYLNVESQIAVRVLSKKEGQFPDHDFIKNRIKDAIKLRLSHFKDNPTDAYRLINSEGDLLPGLIVDRYSNILVIQVLTMGMERFRDVIINTLIKELSPNAIWERSDSTIRKKEGLEQINSLIYGNTEPVITILENGIRFHVDIKGGQKTGFYLDQRENRKELTNLSYQKEILNCFSYTGGFAVYGLKARAKHVTNVEFSSSVLNFINDNILLNDLPEDKVTNILGDAFQVLRKLREEKKEYDIVILDPPKFAQSQSQLKAAIRGYKDINLQAMHLIRPGGLLITFSCSGAVSIDLFSKIIAWAAIDAQKDVQILKRLGQPLDHPFLPGFSESEYLKGLIVQVS